MTDITTEDAELAAVLTFWFEEVKPAQWFTADPELDATVKARFLALYQAVAAGQRPQWRDSADGCLVEILVLDQFSRNMFRGEVRAFATDERARACLAHALEQGFNEQLDEHRRAFLYMPYQHSESLEDQQRSVELFEEAGNPENLDYALRHKQIIERFGRFPQRNLLLERTSTPDEIAYLLEPNSTF